VVTFITTLLITLVAIIIWRWNVLLVVAFFVIFGTLDALYMSSALTKVPHGAWFTILLSGIISVIFILWRYGKESQWAVEGEDKVTVSHLLTSTAARPGPSISSGMINEEAIPKEMVMQLTAAYGQQSLTPISSLGIFFDKIGHNTYLPLVFTQFLLKFHALPTISIFFHMRPLSVPSVPPVERYVIQRVPAIPGAYRLTIRHGYADDIITPNIGQLLIEQLTLFITRDPSTLNDGTSSSSAKSVNHTPEVQAELEAIKQAAEQQVVYVMGKEQMRVKKGTNFMRKMWLEAFLWIRENSRAKVGDWDIPVDQLVEVGFVKEI
jgi:KUP system potassium uptake protein